MKTKTYNLLIGQLNSEMMSLYSHCPKDFERRVEADSRLVAYLAMRSDPKIKSMEIYDPNVRHTHIRYGTRAQLRRQAA